MPEIFREVETGDDLGEHFMKSSAVPETFREVETGDDLGEHCGEHARLKVGDVEAGEAFGEDLRVGLIAGGGEDRSYIALPTDETGEDGSEDSGDESLLPTLSVMSVATVDANEMRRIVEELFGALDTERSLLLRMSRDVDFGLQLAEECGEAILLSGQEFSFPQ